MQAIKSVSDCKGYSLRIVLIRRRVPRAIEIISLFESRRACPLQHHLVPDQDNAGEFDLIRCDRSICHDDPAVFTGRKMLNHSNGRQRLGKDGHFVNVSVKPVSGRVENAASSNMHVET